MKIVIYALGEVFEKNRNSMAYEGLVSFCDKKVSFVEGMESIPVCKPEQLKNIEYDYIVICSNRYFEEIKQELIGEYGVNWDCIVSWKTISSEKSLNRPLKRQEMLEELCAGQKRILDASCLLQKTILSKNALDKTVQKLDAITSLQEEANVNLYQDVYTRQGQNFEIQSSIKDGYYDVSLYQMLEECEAGDIEYLCRISKRVVVFFEGCGILKLLQMAKEQFAQYMDTHIYAKDAITVLVADSYTDVITLPAKMSIDVYVAMHRPYHSITTQPYKPICLGGYQNDGYFSEQSGDNISQLNEKLNETTALYWIWKNTDSEFVGLNHYRRYFYRNNLEYWGNFLNLSDMQRLLSEYDLLLPRKASFERTIREQLAQTIEQVAFDSCYELVRKKIGLHQKEYLAAFDGVMNGYSLYPCNLFIAKRDVMNRYCEWLFSFMIEVAEEMDVSTYDLYSKRVVGFFAERMWTVWLRKNKVSMIELPYVQIK